jgi:DNA-directed RNA polymerase specialized sigma24 family protein
MSHTGTRDPGGRLDVAAEDYLVTLAMSGDDVAFSELVRRRQKRVRDTLRRLCGDHALADDLAQKTFVLVWRGISKLRDPGAFGGWLKRVTVNAWLAEARRVQVPIDDDEDAIFAAPDPAPSPERSAAQRASTWSARWRGSARQSACASCWRMAKA